MRIAQNASPAYTHVWRTLGHFSSNPMGIHWTGIVFGLGAVISFGYWTTDFLVVQRVLSAHNLRAAQTGASYWRWLQDVRTLHRYSARPAWPGTFADQIDRRRRSAGAKAGIVTTKCCR